MRLAKIKIKDNIRARGQRIKDYEMAEITKWAELWLGEHRAELIGQAWANLWFAAERNSELMHRQSRPEKSRASVVQISGAK